MALTHSSYANEHRAMSVECNERLEFLGDSILGMLVAEHLFKKYPDMPEGKMTKLRAELVCEKSLAEVAASLQLGQYLLLGKGEEQYGGRTRPSINADAVEALLAAVYIDGGFEPVKKIISRYILVKETNQHSSDYKTELQEIVQRNIGSVLSYDMVGEEGPDHMKTFTAEVRLNGEQIGLGKGKTKKEAEQAAAHSAICALEVKK